MAGQRVVRDPPVVDEEVRDRGRLGAELERPLADRRFRRLARQVKRECGSEPEGAGRDRGHRQHGVDRVYAALISMILNFSLEPRGVATSTVSPFFRPMIALPTGDSFESLRSTGFASAEPTMKYSTVSFASTSRRRTTEPTETTLVSMSFGLITRACGEPLVELGDAVLEHHLLVLRVVVLGVLGDLAERAGGRDPLRDLPALLSAKALELALQLLVALGCEDHILHQMPSETRWRGPRPRQNGREW